MTAGRPTEYDPILCEKVDDYLKTTGREQTSLATIEGFAVYLDTTKQTLYEWAKAHKEFGDALSKILTIQGKQLIDDGIYGGKEINASIVKLLLMANHGMRERTDMTSNDKQLPTPIYGGKSKE